jgi:hypothetical protein
VIITASGPDRNSAGQSCGRDSRHAQVVALRRAGSPSPPPARREHTSGATTGWSAGHKVRQWYLSLQQHKVIYRGPFIKGDTGKPLLAGDVVRGLVR